MVSETHRSDMRRSMAHSVQRARFRYSVKDVLVVSVAMFGALVLALLVASHGTVVAAAVVSFLVGRRVQTVQAAGRQGAKTLRQTVRKSSVVGPVRRAIAAASFRGS